MADTQPRISLRVSLKRTLEANAKFFKTNKHFMQIGLGCIHMAKLFGSSGVRGLANVDITPILACKVGSAVATYAKAKKAVVAKDTRVSGDMIEDALVAGLVSCGVEVFLADIVPTPVCAFAAKALGADVGFMLTASHNPPQYNGIKVFKADLSYTDAEQDDCGKNRF